jgi:hypothetical protein
MDSRIELNYFDFYNAASGKMIFFSDMKAGSTELKNKIKEKFWEELIAV